MVISNAFLLNCNVSSRLFFPSYSWFISRLRTSHFRQRQKWTICNRIFRKVRVMHVLISESCGSTRDAFRLMWRPDFTQWRNNGRDGFSNHQRLDCLLTVCSAADQRKHQSSASLTFVRESTGDRCIPSQRASNVESVSIWRRHPDKAFLAPCFIF